MFRARRLERFLTQPFFSTEQFTGQEGRMVPLADALEGCERILNDEFAEYPESSLYMIGKIDEARNHETQNAVTHENHGGRRGHKGHRRSRKRIILPLPRHIDFVAALVPGLLSFVKAGTGRRNFWRWMKESW